MQISNSQPKESDNKEASMMKIYCSPPWGVYRCDMCAIAPQ